MNVKNLKSVYGFFLCKKINQRLLWQFYILNREAWIGEPISIIPMEIKDYTKILGFMYKNDITAVAFERLLEDLAKSSLKTKDYMEWAQQHKKILSNFTKNAKVLKKL